MEKLFWGARVTWKETYAEGEYVFKGKITAIVQEKRPHDDVILLFVLVGNVRSKREGMKNWYRNKGQKKLHPDVLELDWSD